ncbi:MAG: HlyD family type I secretion periplasmic adaptor subunit [Telluria sp.]
MKLIDKQGLATDVVVRDVTPETVHTDPRAYARLGWFVVLFGVIGFFLWAIFAPLDKGVPMAGFVAKESNRKAIQPQQGGVVDAILVKEGDHVKAGQVLIRMNQVNAKAEADMAAAQYFTARLAEARLTAERDGQPAPVFPAELAPYKNDPRVSEALTVQNQLFNSRREALRNELAALEESMTGLKSQIAGQQASRDSKKEQLAILKEQLTNLRDLSKDGYVPRARLLDVERQYAQTAGSIAEDTGNIGHAQAQITELTLRRAQRLAEFQRDVRTQLADVTKEADALVGKMAAGQYALSGVEVRAPVDGTVMGISVFTKGAVVSPGFKLMDVVPESDPLVIEGNLPINLVDKVHPGLPVEFIFSAFNQSKTPHIPGVITNVSADRFVDEHSGQPYYKVTAKVTQKGMDLVIRNKLEIRPGMPAELFVKTGERSMMSYLLKPVFDRAHTSLSEE